VPKTVKVDALASEIMSLLHEYANDVTSDMKKDIDSVARGTVKRIKEKAPVRHDGRKKKYEPGSYRDSWRSTIDEENSYRKSRIVYAGGHQYSLTHLLENGHRIVRPDKTDTGRRTKPIAHIKPAEDWAVNELETRTIRRIKENSN
jgi:hypothetical protein